MKERERKKREREEMGHGHNSLEKMEKHLPEGCGQAIMKRGQRPRELRSSWEAQGLYSCSPPLSG